MKTMDGKTMNKQIKCLKYALIGAAIGLAGMAALGCLLFMVIILTAATMYIFHIDSSSMLAPAIAMFWLGIILGVIFGALTCMEKKDGR